MDTNRNNGIVILGGGLAGLAAAHVSGAPIFESNDRIGGVAGTKLVDGFAFDHGIHVLQTKHSVIRDLFSSVGVGLCTRERKAMVYSHGIHTAYPFQVNTAGLPLKLRLHCVWNYLRRDRSFAPENYEQWINQTIGKGFGETFLIPYSDKFWTVHPREMTSEWTGNRVPKTSLRHVFRGALIDKQTKVGTNAVFEYPDPQASQGIRPGAGFGGIATKIRERLSSVHLNHRAVRIDTTKRKVEFAGETECAYQFLVSTIPLPNLVRLIPDAPEEVRAAAGRLRHNSIVVVNLGIDSPRISDRHWVHYPEKDISFFRISYPHNLGPGMVPEGMSSISAEVSYSAERPVDKESIVARVIEDLRRVNAMRLTDRVIVTDVMDIKYGYVIYDQQRKEAVRTIHDWLKTVDIYPTGRYGLWAYLWSHESILAGMKCASELSEQGVEV